MISLPEETSAPAPAPAKSGGDDNLMAALSYISIISIVMLLVKKDSDYVQFHAKQGVILFIGEVVLWVLSAVLWFLFFIWWIIGLVFFVASIIGFIKAYGGERYRLPVVGDLAGKINL